MNQAPPDEKNSEEQDEMPIHSMRALHRKIKSLYSENQIIAALYIKGYSPHEIARLVKVPEDYVVRFVNRFLIFMKKK